MESSFETCHDVVWCSAGRLEKAVVTGRDPTVTGRSSDGPGVTSDPDRAAAVPLPPQDQQFSVTYATRGDVHSQSALLTVLYDANRVLKTGTDKKARKRERHARKQGGGGRRGDRLTEREIWKRKN